MGGDSNSFSASSTRSNNIRCFSCSFTHSYRRILALLSNTKKYGRKRLNNACGRALHINSPTRSSVKSILKQGLDLVPIELPGTAVQEELSRDAHENIRGEDYYH